MKKTFICVVLILCVALVGCEKIPQSEVTPTVGGASASASSSVTSAAATVEPDYASDSSDMFSGRDYEVGYESTKAVRITLTGDGASCSDSSVVIDGTTVTITDEGDYIISGSLSDGMIIVSADETDKPHLVFDGVSVTSSTSAALYITVADKVFVTLAEGSVNTLANGGEFVAVDENNIDGAVFSKQDLTFNGEGSLTVDSPAGHGIVCKDDLVFTGGSITVRSASHAIDANDSFRLANAEVTLDAGKDGVHVENDENAEKGFVYILSGSMSIEAEGDGISAGHYAQIEDGSFDILCGGGSSNGASHSSDFYGGYMGRPGSSSSSSSSDDSTSIKGIKAVTGLLINGGSFNINSADDAFHSNGDIAVNGGDITIASGDDGFHADNTLTVTAGTVTVTESYEGIEGLDIAISGGTIKLKSSDDGINAAGGTDSSGTGGNRGGDRFGGMGGGMGGGMSAGNGSIVISGGDLFINASGDGIDANGSLTITGGYTVVVGPTQGDTATLDYDTTAVITGGTFIGTGASNMAVTFNQTGQGVIAVSVGTAAAGTTITLTDSNGDLVVSYTPELNFQVVILSAPGMVSGETYTITVGQASGSFKAN